MTRSLALMFFLLSRVFAQEAGPEELVKKITDDVMAAIKSDKQLAAGDKQKALKLAEEKILPHVDFEEATRLAVGRALVAGHARAEEEAGDRVPQHAGAHLLERHQRLRGPDDEGAARRA